MNRRQLIFRVGQLVLILPAASFLEACGKTTEAAGTGTDDDADESGPGSTGSSLTATSSSNGHTHTFTISAADLATPPSSGISESDSSSGGHSHTVTLTQQNVTDIAAGTAVNITSGTASGHTHSYTFQRS